MKQNRSFSQAKWNNRTKWAIFVFCLVQQMNYLEQFQENTKIDRYFKYQIYNKQFFFLSGNAIKWNNWINYETFRVLHFKSFVDSSRRNRNEILGDDEL